MLFVKIQTEMNEGGSNEVHPGARHAVLWVGRLPCPQCPADGAAGAAADPTCPAVRVGGPSVPQALFRTASRRTLRHRLKSREG